MGATKKRSQRLFFMERVLKPPDATPASISDGRNSGYTRQDKQTTTPCDRLEAAAAMRDDQEECRSRLRLLFAEARLFLRRKRALSCCDRRCRSHSAIDSAADCCNTS